jgi:flagellar motor protein MotB
VAESKQPIIIRRKKAGHAGAHGGAWKVAFADFMTAMMAFFLVMWLMGSDEETKASISNYFNNPTSALRVDLSNNQNVPLGDKTGAGESVLRGADGEVPEELVQNPSKPLIDGNTQAEDASDAAAKLASSGDRILVEVMRFSVLEDDLFQPGTTDKWKPGIEKIFQKIGKLAKNQERSKLTIRGAWGTSETGNYDFQVARAVAVARFLVDHKLVEDERISTTMRRKKSDSDGRRPASSAPRIDFIFQ